MCEYMHASVLACKSADRVERRECQDAFLRHSFTLCFETSFLTEPGELQGSFYLCPPPPSTGITDAHGHASAFTRELEIQTQVCTRVQQAL